MIILQKKKIALKLGEK